MNCAWCETATGELVVPGARGAFVHPTCEAARRGRRWFLGALGLGAAAVVAAPLLELVPEALEGRWTGLPGVISLDADFVETNFAAINALLMGEYAKTIPQLYKRDRALACLLEKYPDPPIAPRVLRLPRIR